MHQPVAETLDEYECPGERCPMCSGALCSLCGAGVIPLEWVCEHDVIERHENEEDEREGGG